MAEGRTDSSNVLRPSHDWSKEDEIISEYVSTQTELLSKIEKAVTKIRKNPEKYKQTEESGKLFQMLNEYSDTAYSPSRTYQVSEIESKLLYPLAQKFPSSISYKWGVHSERGKLEDSKALVDHLILLFREDYPRFDLYTYNTLTADDSAEYGIFPKIKKEAEKLRTIPKMWEKIKASLKKTHKIDNIEKYVYRGIPILIHHTSEKESAALAENIHASVKAMKIAIDKIFEVGFEKFFRGLTTNLYVSWKAYKLSYSGKGAQNAGAFYRDSDKSINFYPLDKENSTQHLIHLLVHEFGHAVHYNFSEQGRKEWKEFYDTYYKKFQAPTKYALKNDGEYFAELFSYIVYPQYRHFSISPELVRAFKLFLRKYLDMPLKESKLIPYKPLFERSK
jgi:predicted SprT family Zn-dependent metalloprotease